MAGGLEECCLQAQELETQGHHQGPHWPLSLPLLSPIFSLAALRVTVWLLRFQDSCPDATMLRDREKRASLPVMILS